jgi:hypothetical protein
MSAPWSLGGAIKPLAVLCAALLALLLAATPSTATPLIETAQAAAPAAPCLALDPSACDRLPAAPEAVTPALATNWYGIPTPLPAARTAPQPDLAASVAPIPLPAAGWLLVAGLGALGLFRRRGTQPAPLRTTLRGCARTDLARPRTPARLFPAAAPLDLSRRSAARSERLTAFAPGRATRARPTGAAGVRGAATAERAPPPLAGCIARVESQRGDIPVNYTPARQSVSALSASSFAFLGGDSTRNTIRAKHQETNNFNSAKEHSHELSIFA